MPVFHSLTTSISKPIGIPMHSVLRTCRINKYVTIPALIIAPTNSGTVVPKRALPRVFEMPKVVPAKLGAMSMKEEKKPGEMAPLKKKPMQIWELWGRVIVPRTWSKNAHSLSYAYLASIHYCI